MSESKFDKPDELTPERGDNVYGCFPKGSAIRYYYLTDQTFWGSIPDHKIASDMGFNIDKGKLKNLASFGGELELWYYLNILPSHLRDGPIADEWINFILGPLAAALKVSGLGFESRERVICVQGLLVMLEAMEIDLIPPGKRKPLYEALISRFNNEFYSSEIVGEDSARLVFYSILADVVEPIFAEASGDELGAMIDKVLADNPKQAADAKTDPKVVGWIMGQILRSSPTKLDPNTVRAAITAKL
jgi:hypothetical protein